MKHKNCIKCGKSLKTLEGQQSGIGPECKKNIAKNIFVKETNNSDYSFVDGEIEWLLNDCEYDMVTLYVTDDYYKGRFKEIHWTTNTPPFIHSLVMDGYNDWTTDIKAIPPVAISNLLHDLGYSTQPNNKRVLMEEVWVNHKVEVQILHNTIGTGLNDELPCLVALGDPPDEDWIDDYFSEALMQDSNSGFRDSMNDVNSLPVYHAMTILLFRQGFGMKWQKLLNQSFGYEYFEVTESYIFESKTLSSHITLHTNMKSDREWLFNLGDIQIINPLKPFMEWLNKKLASIPRQEVDSVDYYIMSGIEREQLAEDAALKVEELCTIAEFNGLAGEEIRWGMHRVNRIMDEIYLENMFWNNFVRYDQNGLQAIESFTRVLFSKLEKHDISLPRIVDTWH
ncbi:MAG: hypothetical protein CMA57_03495 [Euryarchaeota archaeon]|jgi:hypothetical protein|nr:hypothetical protein [Euryarchaeota archaeon]|tara:strand:- start:5120 stop:6307 length:1188 start_codon:yes stop_codon:yes gene_type:complete